MSADDEEGYSTEILDSLGLRGTARTVDIRRPQVTLPHASIDARFKFLALDPTTASTFPENPFRSFLKIAEEKVTPVCGASSQETTSRVVVVPTNFAPSRVSYVARDTWVCAPVEEHQKKRDEREPKTLDLLHPPCARIPIFLRCPSCMCSILPRLKLLFEHHLTNWPDWLADAYPASEPRKRLQFLADSVVMDVHTQKFYFPWDREYSCQGEYPAAVPITAVCHRHQLVSPFLVLHNRVLDPYIHDRLVRLRTQQPGDPLPTQFETDFSSFMVPGRGRKPNEWPDMPFPTVRRWDTDYLSLR